MRSTVSPFLSNGSGRMRISMLWMSPHLRVVVVGIYADGRYATVAAEAFGLGEQQSGSPRCLWSRLCRAGMVRKGRW
jgi:hypothetical protein